MAEKYQKNKIIKGKVAFKNLETIKKEDNRTIKNKLNFITTKKTIKLKKAKKIGDLELKINWT